MTREKVGRDLLYLNRAVRDKTDRLQCKHTRLSIRNSATHTSYGEGR